MLGEESLYRSHPHADFKYVYRYVNSYPPTPAPNLSSFYKSTHDLICWFYFCLFPCINHLHGISYCQTVKLCFYLWHSNIRVLMFIQSKRHYAWVLASWAIIVGHCCSCDLRASYHSFKKCYFYLHLKPTICPCSAQNIGPLLTIHYSYEKSLEWVMVDKIYH